MGSSKQKESGTTVINQTTTPTPTAEETELNKLQLAQAREFDPIQRALNQAFGNLALQLGTGQALPGYLSSLPGGINPDVTQSIVNRSMRDLAAQSQQMGLPIDSGTYQSIAGRTAGDIRMGAEEFNLGQLLNLLNLSIGAPAQIQQPALATSQMLSGRLAGLRSTNTQGTQSMSGFRSTNYDFFTSPFTSAALGATGTAFGGFSGGRR